MWALLWKIRTIELKIWFIFNLSLFFGGDVGSGSYNRKSGSAALCFLVHKLFQLEPLSACKRYKKRQQIKLETIFEITLFPDTCLWSMNTWPFHLMLKLWLQCLCTPQIECIGGSTNFKRSLYTDFLHQELMSFRFKICITLKVQYCWKRWVCRWCIRTGICSNGNELNQYYSTLEYNIVKGWMQMVYPDWYLLQ